VGSVENGRPLSRWEMRVGGEQGESRSRGVAGSRVLPVACWTVAGCGCGSVTSSKPWVGRWVGRVRKWESREGE
jgi:hypothetical protein